MFFWLIEIMERKGNAEDPSLYDESGGKGGCTAAACQGIYESTPEGLRDLTPEAERCLLGACPGAYERGESYLIIGRTVDPRELGLAQRVGKGETLIEISKNLLAKIAKGK